MKAWMGLMTLVLAVAASGCTTYQERVIDEGTVVEQRTIVE